MDTGYQKRVHAFSLVELSIVLVILGLLTGGILAGQSLIRAAELRSVVSDYHRYMTAMRAFQDRYLSLPGDMPDATDFWGSMTNCGAANPSGSGTQTCNGNGDGQMNNPSAGAQTGESFGFWKQLANAGLIEGTYSGIAGSDYIAHNPGINCPASRLANGTWAVSLNTGGDASPYDYYINGNSFLFGRERENWHPNLPILRPEEAWNIDTKIDDGKPARGALIARGYNNSCAAADTGSSTNTNFDASYRVSDKTLQCTLRFLW